MRSGRGIIRLHWRGDPTNWRTQLTPRRATNPCTDFLNQYAYLNFCRTYVPGKDTVCETKEAYVRPELKGRAVLPAPRSSGWHAL